MFRKVNKYFFDEEVIPVAEAAWFYLPYVLGLVAAAIAISFRIF